ncbi:hypothetical protein FZEAL_5872 [Fusarium zealandicum]|uniref:Uncharacterized protein n=1 Tax=Fusarium zealandicum TaxID=1053134 RepID=A0A8H4UJ07_9HYPO|nr:hypothetical protein FZEAL_5872 [Fusarium zealandicum]
MVPVINDDDHPQDRNRYAVEAPWDPAYVDGGLVLDEPSSDYTAGSAADYKALAKVYARIAAVDMGRRSYGCEGVDAGRLRGGNRLDDGEDEDRGVGGQRSPDDDNNPEDAHDDDNIHSHRRGIISGDQRPTSERLAAEALVYRAAEAHCRFEEVDALSWGRPRRVLTQLRRVTGGFKERGHVTKGSQRGTTGEERPGVFSPGLGLVVAVTAGERVHSGVSSVIGVSRELRMAQTIVSRQDDSHQDDGLAGAMRAVHRSAARRACLCQMPLRPASSRTAFFTPISFSSAVDFSGNFTRRLRRHKETPSSAFTVPGLKAALSKAFVPYHKEHHPPTYQPDTDLITARLSHPSPAHLAMPSKAFEEPLRGRQFSRSHEGHVDDKHGYGLAPDDLDLIGICQALGSANDGERYPEN